MNVKFTIDKRIVAIALFRFRNGERQVEHRESQKMRLKQGARKKVGTGWKARQAAGLGVRPSPAASEAGYEDRFRAASVFFASPASAAQSFGVVGVGRVVIRRISTPFFRA